MDKRLMLNHACAIVVRMIGRDAAALWWKGRNVAFNMKTPEEFWETDPETVYQYLLDYTQK